jgi:hypothetical protein
VLPGQQAAQDVVAPVMGEVGETGVDAVLVALPQIDNEGHQFGQPEAHVASFRSRSSASYSDPGEH